MTVAARDEAAYRGEDRRRTARGADESLAWIAVGAAALTAVALVALAWTVLGLPTAAALSDSLLVLLLRTAAATGVGFVAVLLLRRARLTGEAAPRLIAAAALALAVGTVLAELPAAVGPLLTGAFAIRVGSVLVAAGLLVAAGRWPTVDARLGTWSVVAVAVVAGAIATGLVLLALTLAPVEPARIVANVAVAVAVALAMAALVVAALRWRRRLFAAAALLALAWAFTQMLAFSALPGTELAAVFEALRFGAVVLVGMAALDDLAATFDAQSSALLRTELDRRSAEQELVTERRLAEERAHEARSALTAIEGASSMLGRYRQSLDPDGRVALTEAIKGEIRRLQRLVEDPAAALQPEPLDLAALVAREAEHAEREGTRVRNLLERGCLVHADAHTVAGIVRNLLVNARVHAPEATVTLALRDLDDPGRVALVVSDDGPGLPGDPEALFERGRRGPDSGERPGSGLGLHVARSLAERNDGALWAEPTPGGGATFVLVLPAETADVTPEQARGHPRDAVPAEVADARDPAAPVTPSREPAAGHEG